MEFDEFGRKIKDTTAAVAEKAGEVAKNIGKKAGDFIEEGRINNKIKVAESAIDGEMYKLGQLLYKANGCVSDDEKVNAIIAGINERKQEIISLKSDLASVRGQVYCENCGSYNPAESKFCNNCGADIKIIEEITEEEKTEE